jgi:O-antigen/teichoic acid export membrane protein
MARMLSIIDYGILAALYAIIYILGIFIESIQTVMMKYSSGENDNGRLKSLLKKTLKKKFIM